MRDDGSLPRVALDPDRHVPEPGVSAWVRFLLRLAAIAWALGTLPVILHGLWFSAPADADCVPQGAALMLLVTGLGGTALLVRAVGAGGSRQRRALVAASLLAVLWLLALLLAWQLPGSLWCSTGDRLG
jgi:hypothetical protein